jgi:hypothetical protein
MKCSIAEKVLRLRFQWVGTANAIGLARKVARLGLALPSLLVGAWVHWWSAWSVGSMGGGAFWKSDKLADVELRRGT